MIASIVTWARTLLMKVKLLMMWCGFIGRGVNGECNQVKRREALELEEFSWLDLPTEVFELIILKLPFVDHPKLACVCKSWRDTMQTLPPIYPVGKNPLLLHVKSRGGGEEEGAIFHYYSPSLNKSFQVCSPLDLRGYEIIYSRDGTLLIYNQDEMKMMMVDPFSGCSVNFPGITDNLSFNGTAIGVHDGYYVIFLIDTSDENEVTVHMYDRLGWVLDLAYVNDGNEPFYMSSNPVFCDGRFYCLGTKGDRLGVFDLLEWTWRVYKVEFMNKHDNDDLVSSCYHLVDWIDTVMAVRVENYGSGINLFRLDREKMVWEETDDLAGRSLFLGSTLSTMSLPTDKKLRNRVFLPHSHQDEPKTVLVAKVDVSHNLFYFKSKSFISSKEKNHAATTICCCNRSWEEPLHFGSTQKQNLCTIWFQPL